MKDSKKIFAIPVIAFIMILALAVSTANATTADTSPNREQGIFDPNVEWSGGSGIAGNGGGALALPRHQEYAQSTIRHGEPSLPADAVKGETERGRSEGGSDKPVDAISPLFVEMGARFFYTDYEEDIDPPQRSTNSGWLPGMYLDLGYRKNNGLYLRFSGSYASGDLAYDGSDQNGTAIYFSNDPQKFYRFEANVGYVFQAGPNTSLVPYIGYGYRYWERGEANPSIGNYREVYDWHYLSLGIRIEHDLNSRWRVGIAAAANIMFMGRMKVSLSELDSGYNDPAFNLGDRIGLRITVPIRYALTGNWSVTGTPWYEYSPIGASDMELLTYRGTGKSLVMEPSSTTTQYGFDLGIAYSF